MHARNRAAERYGLYMDNQDIRLLANRLMIGEGVEFERESRHISKAFILVGDTEIPVVYNRTRGRVITILPPDAKEVIRARERENAS